MKAYRYLQFFFALLSIIAIIVNGVIGAGVGYYMARTVSGHDGMGWGALLFLVGIGYAVFVNRLGTHDDLAESFIYWGKTSLATAIGIFCGYLIGGEEALSFPLVAEALFLGSIAAALHSLGTVQTLESRVRPHTNI